MLKFSQIIFIICLLLALTIATFFSFSELGTAPFGNHDETTHASVAYNMFTSGDYWHPQFNGSRYHNKPPLKMWLTAAGLKFFKVTPFAFRFFSALAGVALALILFIFVNSVYHSGVIALFSVLILFTSKTLLFNHTIRSGTQDSAMVFFATLALFTAWLFIKKCLEKNQDISSKEVISKALICGVAVGCAVLTKSVAGFMPFIVLAIFYFITILLKGFNKKFFIFLSIAGVVSILVASVWYAHLFISSNACVKCMLEFKRFQEGYHNSDDVFIYFHHLFQGISFPFYLWLSALIITVLQIFFAKSERLYPIFLLSWGIGILLFITCLSSRVEHYIDPAIPAFVLMVTNAVVVLFRLARKWFLQGALFYKFMSISALAVVIFFISVTVRADINNYRRIRRDARIIRMQQGSFYYNVINLINTLKVEPKIIFLEDNDRIRLPRLVRYFYNLQAKYPIEVTSSIQVAEQALQRDKHVIVIDDANRITDFNGSYKIAEYLPRIYYSRRKLKKAKLSSVIANFQIENLQERLLLE